MCGIVGYIGTKPASDILINGLRRLEYRGYDSAGVAIVNGGSIQLRRSPGKLSVLEEQLKKQPISGTLGLGHTRWATHGRPSEENAHPHTDCKGEIVIVHNGIIENYIELKKDLEAKGHTFKSQTDTEVLAHLVEEAYDGKDLAAALRATLKKVRGSYAVGVLAMKDPSRFVAARKDSPLVLGLGEDEMFLASDVPAILQHTRKVIFLEDGDVAELTQKDIKITDLDGGPIQRHSQNIIWDSVMAEKGGFKHFMLKEIHEQVVTVRDTFRSRINIEENKIVLENVLPAEVAKKLPKICLVGCGTSYHAALVARFWFEEIAGILCDVEIASEFRYRRSSKEPGTFVVAITQSGETADTLAAMRDSKAKGLPTLALCNAVGSTATREADYTLMTHCGPEIGVASTKAFTGQLTALFLLALYISQCKGTLSKDLAQTLITGLVHLPLAISGAIDNAGKVEQVAKKLFRKNNFLYLGRHLNHPIAMEGALKLKEISYIHAEGYAAGEMKHGPIALIDENLPVVAIATESSVRDKMLSNMQEVKARGGIVIALTHEQDADATKQADYLLTVPLVHEALAPIITIIPLQLLAYYIAVLRGCDVDQPRNLAKSVTVE
jgi:glutamine---fructose-6-phosphate transaminase (isomerizing)